MRFLHSLPHYANTSSGTLHCSHTLTSIIRERLSSYCLFFLSFVVAPVSRCDGLCLQTPPASVSRPSYRKTTKPACRHLDLNKYVVLALAKGNTSLIAFCSSLSIQPNGDTFRSSDLYHKISALPSDSQACVELLNQYISKQELLSNENTTHWITPGCT